MKNRSIAPSLDKGGDATLKRQFKGERAHLHSPGNEKIRTRTSDHEPRTDTKAAVEIFTHKVFNAER